jgi:RNA polymerase sigma-70 factor (ECF subfamily)
MTTREPQELPGAVRAAWHRFSVAFEPLRSDLYRYCRHLTASPWDAEDLAQDTMARAFTTLAQMGQAPPSPRAWLFRVASNLWIDRVRRSRPMLEAEGTVAAPPSVAATREAAGTLITQLAPQERAAVVLKDVFDLSLEEIAEALSTTTGAVKAALHRGRGKLAEPSVEDRVPSRGVVDAFCAAFNAHDVEAVTALLLEGAAVEIVGASTSLGADANRARMFWGMMFGSERLAAGEGVARRFVRGALPTPPRREVRVHRGEAIVLVWYAHDDGEHVRAIDRLLVDGDRIGRVSNYFFTPDVIAEICGELGVSFRSNGYLWGVPAQEAS